MGFIEFVFLRVKAFKDFRRFLLDIMIKVVFLILKGVVDKNKRLF